MTSSETTSSGACGSVQSGNRDGVNATSVASTPEQLLACLQSLRTVRGAATQFFSSLAESDGKENSDCSNTPGGGGTKRKDIVDTEVSVQGLLDDLLKSVKGLQSEVSGLAPVVGGSTQSNLDLLALDPASEKQQLHHQLRQCYIWMDKVFNYSSMCHVMVAHSHLNRSHMPNQFSMSKRRRTPATSYNVNVTQQQVDSLIQSISNLYQDMTLTLSRPNGSNAVLQVTLGRVLRGVITLRGLLVEWVVIRGYSETNLDKHGRVDIFKPSQLAVFQRVTDNASAAMLHFCSPYLADLSIRSFFTWLHSFTNLFTEPCSKCGSTISNNSPPTWREFRTLLPYHQHCRP